MSGEVRCCKCGKGCGPTSDWADEDGLPGHILHHAYECRQCEEDRERYAIEEPVWQK